MSRISVIVGETYHGSTPRPAPPDEFGRSVRQVNAVVHTNSSELTNGWRPLYFKVLAILAVVAALAMAAAVWRLFHFPH